ncbi:hypothetical protein [Roseivirga sp.]|uniref:hypothetical protein n=1 Tax=Roseivirga sp. TaxID=1964215 RepID=UPI003B51D15E
MKSSEPKLLGNARPAGNTQSSLSTVEQDAWVASAVRFTVAATRAAVNYTAAAVRMLTPQVEAVTIQASTTLIITNKVNESKVDYLKQFEVFKAQKMQALG